jgi:hypothetical protein
VPQGNPGKIELAVEWRKTTVASTCIDSRMNAEAISVEICTHGSEGGAGQTNQEKYPGQKLFFVPIDDYIYIVPFEERGEVIWLVTIIPSRKATKMYLEEKNET